MTHETLGRVNAQVLAAYLGSSPPSSTGQRLLTPWSGQVGRPERRSLNLSYVQIFHVTLPSNKETTQLKFRCPATSTTHFLNIHIMSALEIQLFILRYENSCSPGRRPRKSKVVASLFFEELSRCFYNLRKY